MFMSVPAWPHDQNVRHWAQSPDAATPDRGTQEHTLEEIVMSAAIIAKFKKEYGPKTGQRIYYATAAKQHRDTESFLQRAKAATKPRKRR
jgi:hypothetical protein